MNNEFINIFISAIGSSSISILIVGFLSRNLVKHYLEKDRVEFKAQIEQTSAKSIEELKSQLSKLTIEHEIRFHLLHSKRVEIVAELYEYIKNAYSHTLCFAFGSEKISIEHKEKSAEAAFDAISTANKLLENRKIWLSEFLAKQSQEFIVELMSPSFQHHYFVKGMVPEQSVQNAISSWIQNKSKISNMMEDLENEYRAEISGISKFIK